MVSCSASCAGRSPRLPRKANATPTGQDRASFTWSKRHRCHVKSGCCFPRNLSAFSSYAHGAKPRKAGKRAASAKSEVGTRRLQDVKATSSAVDSRQRSRASGCARRSITLNAQPASNRPPLGSIVMPLIPWAALIFAIRSEWGFIAFLIVVGLWLWIEKPWKRFGAPPAPPSSPAGSGRPKRRTARSPNPDSDRLRSQPSNSRERQRQISGRKRCRRCGRLH